MILMEACAGSQAYNAGPIAGSFAAIATSLSGFAVAALIVFLSRQAATASRRDGPESSSPDTLVQGIASAIFYAMTSLAICSFLYAGLSGEKEGTSRGAAGMMLFAPVLALSVLALFYALLLMMTENILTRPAVKYGFWVLVLAGPVVVMRFLASIALIARRPGDCSLWFGLNPVAFGTGLLILVAGISAWVAWLGRPDTVRSVQASADGLVSRMVTALASRPNSPARMVFWLTFAVAVFSLVVSAQKPEFALPGWVSYLMLLAVAVVLAVFSVMCAAALHAPRGRSAVSDAK
jgi:hypothetical protein